MLAGLLLWATSPAHDTSFSPVQQSEVERITPLQSEEQKLLASTVAVQYGVIRKAFPNFSTSEGAFRISPLQDRLRLTSKAFYTASLEKAFLLTFNRPELVSILNQLESPEMDFKVVALQFETKFHEIMGKWPDIVGVDTDAVTTRLLDRATIR